jgi:hypothetical protein
MTMRSTFSRCHLFQQRVLKNIFIIIFFAIKILKYGNFNYKYYYPAITVNPIAVGSKDLNLVKAGAYDE